MPSAPLVPLTIVNPGIAGMNSQASVALLGPEWASLANNLVYDEENRLSARNGWTAVTGTAIGGTPAIEQIFQHRKLDGTTNVVSAAGNKLYSGTTSLTDISGAVSISANNWQFTNFNGSVYGLQTGHALVSWSGSSNFANVTAASGSVPTGNCILSAFGRLWGSSSDGQTVKYSGLLDATNWGATGSGSITLTNVWTDGVDQVQALGAFNNYLVIFGKRHVILYTDGTGSVIGLDPANIEVSDIIAGIGCMARDSVQNVGGDDLYFLSTAGLYSVRRVIEQFGNPLRELSRNVRQNLSADVASTTYSQIRSTYNAYEGIYALLLPTRDKFYVFDTLKPLEDGSLRVTTWGGNALKSLFTLDDNRTTYAGKLGKIFSYSGTSDAGASYRLTYESGWMALSPEVADRLKILKRIVALVEGTGEFPVVVKWGFDFRDTEFSAVRYTESNREGGEWNVLEWNIGEWGSGTNELSRLQVPGTGTGQFVKVAIEVDYLDMEFSLQQIQLFAKIGRTA